MKIYIYLHKIEKFANFQPFQKYYWWLHWNIKHRLKKFMQKGIFSIRQRILYPMPFSGEISSVIQTVLSCVCKTRHIHEINLWQQPKILHLIVCNRSCINNILFIYLKKSKWKMENCNANKTKHGSRKLTRSKSKKVKFNIYPINCKFAWFSYRWQNETWCIWTKCKQTNIRWGYWILFETKVDRNFAWKFKCKNADSTELITLMLDIFGFGHLIL